MGQWRSQARRARGGPATGGLWEQGTRGGAHVEHGDHVRDAGRVEAQRLIERRRELPSRKQGFCDEGGGVCTGREAWELGRVGQWRAQARRARGGPATGGLWEQGTRGGAHVEHAAHVRDAGRVEAQRLIEGRRALPSRKQGMR